MLKVYSEGNLRGIRFGRWKGRSLIDMSVGTSYGEYGLAIGVSFSRDIPLMISGVLGPCSFFMSFFEEIPYNTERDVSIIDSALTGEEK